MANHPAVSTSVLNNLNPAARTHARAARLALEECVFALLAANVVSYDPEHKTVFLPWDFVVQVVTLAGDLVRLGQPLPYYVREWVSTASTALDYTLDAVREDVEAFDTPREISVDDHDFAQVLLARDRVESFVAGARLFGSQSVRSDGSHGISTLQYGFGRIVDALRVFDEAIPVESRSVCLAMLEARGEAMGARWLGV